MLAARGFAVALLVAFAACGTRTTPADDETTAAAASSSSSGGGSVPCGPTPCAADAYCFHFWSCTGGDACSKSCPCSCGTLPAGCPMTMPCSCPGGGGYFGSPGDVFSGPDAGDPFPGHEVHCYGS